MNWVMDCCFDGVWETDFAELTAETLPEVGGHVVAELVLLLALDPLLQTVGVNVPHSPSTLAGRDELVIIRIFFSQAYPAQGSAILGHLVIQEHLLL